MTARTGRIAVLAAVVAVAFTLGGAVGTVAADQDGESEVDFDVGATTSQASGGTDWDCSGTPTASGCEKTGTFDGGPVSIDYEGYNYARPTELEGGGGDHFDVTVQDQTVEFGFDCTFALSPEAPCTVETPSP